MKKINVSGQISQTINFAMQQNYVPVIRNLIVTNEGACNLGSLRLRITCEPAFAKPYECLVSPLKVGEATEITPVNLMVSPEYLMSLTERMLAILHIEVRENNEEMTLLFTKDVNLQLLAYDEWSGLFIMPEMVAAFVTPNGQAVMEIVSAAGQFLMSWIGDPAFTGYQRQNPHIVKMQMAAIYAALQSKNIAYCMPQASFETVGQRIRLPETVLEQRLGTCLDLSVLYAACLEAVGLNPLLIFKDGHCFAGAWLDEKTFADSVMDDVTSLNKRIASGIEEIALIECTDFVVGKSIDFDTSVKHGANHLTEPDKFKMAVDITRSRGSGIRPMPTRVLQNGVFVAADYGERKKKDITEAPTMTNGERHVLNTDTEKLTKQKLWERKLLDLSLRNPLLSFRVNRSAVQLMVADLSVIEDELVKGEGFKIMPRPNDWVNTLKDSKIYEIENDKDLIVTISESEFKSKRIRTFLDEQELTKNMKYLHRQAKTSMEENGSNTLYLAMGFLKWYETDLSEKARYAPLILVPVDLVRRVQDKSYTLRIRDEETQVNITLLELLRQDFGIQIGGLDPLPQDETGVDVMMVLNTFRQAVMEKKGWDVEEWAFVGLFSFSRFIMWNDLRNRSEDLKKNKVVASLMEGKLTFTEKEDDVDAEMLDDKGLPSDMAVPMSADASQMMAIHKAAKGTSFVLHGPPGTGKSQTITNMIANALYQGKTVLFVAEKMAALNVVENRLGKIGLDPFCLELHSNKSQKRAVLNQLQNTLNVTHTASPAEYEETAKELKSLRNQMNEVVTLLHEPLQCGKSLRDIIAIYEDKKEYKGKIKFEENLLTRMNRESYDVWKEAIKALVVAADECGNISNHPLSIVELRQYSMEYRDQIALSLQQFVTAASKWNDAYLTLTGQLGLNPSNGFEGGYEQLVGLMTLCNVMSTSNQLLPGVIANPVLEQQDGLLRQLMIMGEEINALSGQLLTEFAPSILAYPAQDAIQRLNEAKSSWALAKAMGENKILKEIKAHALHPSKITKERCMPICTLLLEYQQKVAYINQTAPNYYSQFGLLWAGIQTNWAMLKDAYEKSVYVRNVIAGIAKTQPAYMAVMQAIQGILNMPVAVRQNITQLMRQYDELGRECLNKEAYLMGQQIRVDRWRQENLWFASLNEKVNTVVNALGELKQWIVYLSQRDVVAGFGLQNVVTALEEGMVTSQNVIEAYEANFCYTIIMSTIKHTPALAGFQGSQFENTIERLKTTDEKFAELTIKELVAKLSAKIPQSGAVADSSEIGILKKAIKSGGRMMSIRKLFDSIPLLLRRICPCMLMSPISVAQYIDPNFPKFDLVIFDEASQLPTPEAVGAIARGENVIVVGDPKQLPPTSFFQTNHMDEENYEIEDMESVLDDCLTLSMPQTHLLWHYRSRHESLIAYSNAKYYENKLYTFPSPNDLVSEVQFVAVDGFYDKSGTRQNRAEAEAIIEEIVRRMRDPLHKNESIGVVTFSSVQQNLIDDLLVECLHENPDLAKQNDEAEEPIIIKNLENVQGDERDVILFSVGYL